ncbi:ABC transporter related [Thioalkalivibrio sulfidiphilus HL-EbGr7]|uniref:Probable ATP-binding protein YheS n=1 Tax=Thioalkalivibrio sulfidiphilus (strain HL-EbGR7) TaxID=396588 RepID=B8GMF0_THISH|nr:ATP-binding cassette domain-containing protein [Thioalkalivibrio sulfidiphilus]ACL71782.1 ABC transporter related [Thioalkalivibrio sulfidiphilus HL-EbGr7]
MLQLTDLTLRRGPRILFQDADLAVHAGWRVGLTGANGTGKSSLFALIRGQLSPDSGSCALPPDWVIATVAQETPAVSRSALDYAMDGDVELRTLQAELAEAEAAEDGTLMGTLHARLDAIDAYRAESRAGRLLHGLGFTDADLGRPVSDFSGGWRMRLNLSQALMCRSDLLLLDEPTNHLDLDAVLWLEQWLTSYPGTLMLISHDRSFLDTVVDHVVHIEQQRVSLYTGNYSAFELQRAEALAQQQALHERQKREVAHMEAFITRFKAKASKARQAQSRVKALERMTLVAPAHVDSPFHFTFPAPARLPNPLLQLEQVQAGYGDKAVLKGVQMALRPGDRIGLLGPNGAGKSTLIRVLAGAQPPLSGERDAAPDLAVGYFAQHQLEQLDAQATPLLHLQRINPRATEQALRNFLGGFGFAGDAATSPVAPFSGGEKARLVLSMLVYQRPNLLLLDEPTNHLDLEMRLALEIALQEYEGALVVVSHDRHLLESVCDDLWLVAGGEARPFEGDLEDYRQWLSRQDRAPAANTDAAQAVSVATPTQDRRAQRREAAQARQRLKPLHDAVKRLERRHGELETEQARIEASLADPAIYDEINKAKLQDLLARQGALAAELASVEGEWMEALAKLEGGEVEG